MQHLEAVHKRCTRNLCDAKLYGSRRWFGRHDSSQGLRFARRVHWIMIVVFMLAMLPSMPASAAPVHQAHISGSSEVCSKEIGPQTNRVFLPTILAVQDSLKASVSQLFPQQVERRLAYVAGKSYLYNFSLESQLDTNGRTTEGDLTTQSSHSRIDGVVEIAITDQIDNETYQGQLRFRKAYFCLTDGNGYLTRHEDPEVTAALAEPLLFTQLADGQIPQVQFPEEHIPVAVNLQKGILNALQNRLQPGNDYVVEERGTQGNYSAHYVVAFGNDGLTVEKSFDQDDFSIRLQGGDANMRLEQSSTAHATFDAELQIFRQMTFSETLNSGDESNTVMNTTDGYDSVLFWSTHTAHGSLDFLAIEDTAIAALAAYPVSTLVTGDLGSEIDGSSFYEQYLDAENLDLQAELDKLEANPQDMEQYDFLLQVGLMDLDEILVKAIGERIEAGVSDAILSVYIGLLSTMSSPKAQEILLSLVPTTAESAQAAADTAPNTTPIYEQALIGISLLTEPTIATIDGLRARTEVDGLILNSPLGMQAVLVLGAQVEALRREQSTDEERALAQEIVEGLITDFFAVTEELGSGETLEMVQELYLLALGNTGDTELLAVAESLFDTASVTVMSAAVQAMAKVSDQAAEDLLVNILADKERPPVVRSEAATVLRSRNLSRGAASALADYNEEIAASVVLGQYAKEWNYKIGGGYVAVNTPGEMAASVATPSNGAANLSLYLFQDVRASLFGIGSSVANAKVRSYRENNIQKFGAYVGVAGNIVNFKRELQAQCELTKKETLVDQHFTFFSYTTAIPTFMGYPLFLNVRGEGNARVDYEYNLDVCDILIPSVNGKITPSLGVKVIGSAFYEFGLVRAGADLQGTILQADLPGFAGIAYFANQQYKVCVEVRMELKPASVKLVVWVEELIGGYYEAIKSLVKSVAKVFTSIVTFKWKTVWKEVTTYKWVPPKWKRHQQTLFSFKIPYGVAPVELFNQCYSP